MENSTENKEQEVFTGITPEIVDKLKHDIDYKVFNGYTTVRRYDLLNRPNDYNYIVLPMDERAELCVKALEGIDDPTLFVLNAKEMFKHSTVMRLNTELFNFISEVAKHKRPLLTQLASVDSEDTIVSVWAGIGISNPIMRIKEIKNQKHALRELLIRVKNSDFVFSDSDKLNAQILIDTFI